ncbi:MAG: 50S ribosomal protein L11 methyltransferase [Betaproteobacteria bacterium]|nr:50S ribosomal protein L11 methyltransferase [Betaproteobacteria bacterium]
MFELRLVCRQAAVDAVGDALEAVDALSVGVEDADAGSEHEHALFGEPGMPPPAQAWEQSLVTALFADRGPAEAACETVQREFNADISDAEIRAVAEQDWVRLTQSQFAPVEITPEFWVVPSWHTAPEQAATVLRLDPGLAFGTGTHPTTSMCLRWIATHPGQTSVLDYGCGSGILAIGAALCGAGRVVAVDIDTAAVGASQDNALANGVQISTGTPELAHGTFTLVVANILATPLKVLAPLLCAHVEKGGRLLLAGILERQCEELTQAYAPYCAVEVLDSREGWILMSATL